MKRTISQIALSVIASSMFFVAVPNSAYAGADPFVGEISYVGFDYAPVGWLRCDGQSVTINQYQALYSLLGTRFGGSGTSNFNLPDMRGRVPIHQGSAPGIGTFSLGNAGGYPSTTLSTNNLPPHKHPATATSTSNSSVAPGATAASTLYAATTSDSPTAGGNSIANSSAPLTKMYSTTAPSVAMKSGSVVTTLDGVAITTQTDTSVAVGNTGNGASFNIMQPFLTLNCIIATTGIYPERP